MKQILRKRWFFPLSVIVVAAIFALVLQFLVYDLVITPIAYTWWLIKGLLKLVPELAYWWTLITLLFLGALRALFRRIGPQSAQQANPIAQHGPVEQLAFQIERANQGNYFKWAIANYLGELAWQILMQRNGIEIVARRQLRGPEWSPPPAVQAYLEKGLHSSFTQLPRKRFWFRPQKTELDLDLNQVIEYLESKMETKS